MATNDIEFALYQKLDKEREEKRREEYQKLYPDGNYELTLNLSQSKSRGKKVNRKIKDDEVDETNNNNDDIQENNEQEPTLPPLPSRLMSVADVPGWARNQEAWLSKHHQLFAMSEQVEKNNLQVGNGGIYTVEAEVEEDDESNIDTGSVDGTNNDNSGGGGGGGGRGRGNNITNNLGSVSWGLNSGPRRRKATTGVIYDDGLTEAQFMDLVEKNEKVSCYY